MNKFNKMYVIINLNKIKYKTYQTEVVVPSFQFYCFIQSYIIAFQSYPQVIFKQTINEFQKSLKLKYFPITFPFAIFENRYEESKENINKINKNKSTTFPK